MAFLRPSPPNLIAPSQTPNRRLLVSSSTRTLTTTTTTTTTIAKTSSRLGFYQHHIPRCSYEASSSAYFNNNSFSGDEDNYKQKEQGGEQVLYPRPSEIPWNKELCNSVHLLGVVGTPVQIKHLTSGKAVAWTRLGVRKSATDTTWINLTFWNELAHVAFQHVEKGNRIYISGRLVSDTVEGDGEKPQTYYKVTVQQLNFVENSFSPVSLYENDSSSVTAGERSVNHTGSNTGSTSTQELWQAFFANPVDWWDNRKNKRNPKYPDFKHKHTGEALWIEGKYNPSWVKSQLAILDSKMESLHANEASSHDSFVSGDDLTFL